MIEAGVVINKDGDPIYWHNPPNASGGSLPDSRELWAVLWENRDDVLGFAHTHPGVGTPWPSQTDLTTFEAIELALGQKLRWWIATEDKLSVVRLTGLMPDGTCFIVTQLATDPRWLKELRMLSDWPVDGIMWMECTDCDWLYVLRSSEDSSEVYHAHMQEAHPESWAVMATLRQLRGEKK